MNKKNFQLVSIVVIALIAGLLLGNRIASRQLNYQQNSLGGLLNNLVNSSNKIDQLLNLINTNYVDSVELNELTEEMAIDLIAKLDPHSVYIPAKDLEIVNDELEGSFSGIGVQFNIQNDTIMVISVISGGPSERAGLLAGDRIVQVDDSVFTGKTVTNEKVLRTLRGKDKTKVKLGIRRPGTEELLTYSITRDEIPVTSVDISYMVAPKTGLIKVNKFGDTTYKEFLTGIANLKAKGATKFIIDLRENSGGYLERAIAMINEFLPAKQLIVYTEGKSYPRFDAFSDGTGSCINNPVAILIDEFSASASEIFAGAIQDNDRGMVIGRRSFGKGLVQQQFDLRDGSALRLTVARYYTPSGRSIQKPYEKGKGDEYNMDIMNRYLHGEFDTADSIQKNDTVEYKTSKGRTVYGGGGIMPDIFIPRDTTEYTEYFAKVVNYAHLYQFAFAYTDQHRDRLAKNKDWKAMESYLDQQNLLAEFTAYAEKKGVKPVPAQIQLSRNIILTRLKAFISRNILGDEGFYPILFKNDPAVKRAISELNK
ncbi:MAG: S41 family peptidase [Paludibacter sp.]|jgi:carboxyl-terminal processing protease|nr:S41 family peptidase [Paludibacter sp.]